MALLLAPPLASSGAAQEVVHDAPPAATVASPAVAGRRDGRAAAAAHGTSGRFLLGVIGGVPVGFPGLFGDRAPLLAGAVGVGFVIATAWAGSAAPAPTVMDSVSARGPEYERAFRDAYAENLRGRRRVSALLGGAVGLVVGVLILSSVMPAT